MKLCKINNNNVELTLQNNKLKYQLEDVTDLYNILMRKYNNLEESIFKDCNYTV